MKLGFNMKLYKQIALVALAILAGYITMVWLASTYTANARYYISQHCELETDINHSNNENDAKDIYYICEDWE